MTLSTASKPSSRGATQLSSTRSICACGRKRRRASSEGVASTVSPIERRRTTSTRRTPRQSQRAGASGCGSTASSSGASASPARLVQRAGVSGFLSRLFILYNRFVNQHHRNIVTNRIDAPALDALQTAAVILQFDLAPASRAGQNLQQILTNRHL